MSFLSPGRFIIRKSDHRGQTQLNWLKSCHSFSFGDYYDPHWKQFQTLRVMNEDWIAPNSGFGSHPHHDMEIITYVMSGTLEHQDSLGNQYLIRTREVQRMTAGTGIVHSEYNATPDPVHLYQIWILPDQKGLTPSYEQKFLESYQENRLNLIASPKVHDQALFIHQDVSLYIGHLRKNAIDYIFNKNRSGWIQMLQGSMVVHDNLLQTGDGLGIENLVALNLKADSEAQFLLFDLAY